MPNGPTNAALSTKIEVVQAVQNEMKDDLKEVKAKVDRPPIWISLLLSGSAGLNGALITALLTHH